MTRRYIRIRPKGTLWTSYIYMHPVAGMNKCYVGERKDLWITIDAVNCFRAQGWEYQRFSYLHTYILFVISQYMNVMKSYKIIRSQLLAATPSFLCQEASFLPSFFLGLRCTKQEQWEVARSLYRQTGCFVLLSSFYAHLLSTHIFFLLFQLLLSICLASYLLDYQ